LTAGLGALLGPDGAVARDVHAVTRMHAASIQAWRPAGHGIDGESSSGSLASLGTAFAEKIFIPGLSSRNGFPEARCVNLRRRPPKARVRPEMSHSRPARRPFRSDS
jgi:hypothetical protein